MSEIRIRTMFAGEEETMCAILLRTFMHDVAKEYTGDGIAEFRKHANPDAMAARCEDGNIILVAEKEYEPVGVIELQEEKHICSFFVAPEHQRQGIGKKLLAEACSLCSPTTTITVKASPNAVNAYEVFGFSPNGPEQEENGIRFIPMVLRHEE